MIHSVILLERIVRVWWLCVVGCCISSGALLFFVLARSGFVAVVLQLLRAVFVFFRGSLVAGAVLALLQCTSGCRPAVDCMLNPASDRHGGRHGDACVRCDSYSDLLLSHELLLCGRLVTRRGSRCSGLRHLQSNGRMTVDRKGKAMTTA